MEESLEERFAREEKANQRYRKIPVSDAMHQMTIDILDSPEEQDVYASIQEILASKEPWKGDRYIAQDHPQNIGEYYVDMIWTPAKEWEGEIPVDEDHPNVLCVGYGVEGTQIYDTEGNWAFTYDDLKNKSLADFRQMLVEKALQSVGEPSLLFESLTQEDIQNREQYYDNAIPLPEAVPMPELLEHPSLDGHDRAMALQIQTSLAVHGFDADVIRQMFSDIQQLSSKLEQGREPARSEHPIEDAIQSLHEQGVSESKVMNLVKQAIRKTYGRSR